MPTFFQTNLSFFAVLLACVVATAISFYMYRRTVPPVNKKMILLLGIIRGFYTSAIVIFLFKPELTMVWRQHDSKKISVLIDRSASMGISDKDVKRIDQANIIAAKIRNRLESATDLHIIAFDTDTATVSSAEVDSANTGTDIATAINLVEKTKPNPDAIILISDGNYSVGKNPLYRGINGGIPVYTIGIGDTIEPVDILVTNMQSQKIVYQHKNSIIQANIMALGIDSVKLDLELRLGNRRIARKDLVISHPNEEYPVSFDIVPENPGRVTYELYVHPVFDEKNEKNNRALIQMQVLKEKLGVALMTARPGPEYKFIRLLLAANEDLKIFPVINIGRRLGPKLLADSLDVIIWCQIPNDAERNSLTSGTDVSAYPSLLMASERLDGQKMAFLKNYLPISSLSYLGRDVRTQVRPTEGGFKFSPINVLDSRNLNVRFWQAAPPIDYMFGGVKPVSGISVVLETVNSVNQEELGSPVLMTGNSGGRKNALLLGSGFWRWHFLLAEDAQFNNAWKDILHNLIRWLASSRDAKNVQLAVPESDPKTGQKLHLIADVYDGAFEPVDTAVVRFHVSGPDGSFEIPASFISEGKYQGEFVPASEGIYALRSMAWLNDQLLGSDSIRIGVLPVIQEFIHTNQNIESAHPARKGIRRILFSR